MIQSHLLLNLIKTAIISILLIGNVSSQSTTEEILDQKFTDYTLFSQDFDAIESSLMDSDQNGIYEMSIAGYNLNLYSYDLVASNYKAVVVDELGSTEIDVNTDINYRGYVDGDGGSIVALTISEGFIFGSIRQKDATVFIEPVSRISGDFQDDRFIYMMLHL